MLSFFKLDRKQIDYAKGSFSKGGGGCVPRVDWPTNFLAPTPLSLPTAVLYHALGWPRGSRLECCSTRHRVAGRVDAVVEVLKLKIFWLSHKWERVMDKARYNGSLNHSLSTPDALPLFELCSCCVGLQAPHSSQVCRTILERGGILVERLAILKTEQT